MNPSRPYSIGPNQRLSYFFAVIRSHPVARSDSSDRGCFCTHAISVALQISSICSVSEFRSHFIPAPKIDQKPTSVLDNSGKITGLQFRSHIGSQKTNPRSIAYPFTEKRDPIAAPGLLGGESAPLKFRGFGLTGFGNLPRISGGKSTPKNSPTMKKVDVKKFF